MMPREPMMWAGPLPPGETEVEVEAWASGTETFAGPWPAAGIEAKVETIATETVMWSGALPPNRIEPASSRPAWPEASRLLAVGAA